MKAVMQENITQGLQNCVKLESIQQQAEELQMQAGVFKKNAVELKNKMRCKEIKTKLIMAFIFLAIVGSIVGIAVWQSKKATPDAQ